MEVVTDMGRWREKNEDMATSVVSLFSNRIMIELAIGDIPSRLRCWVLGTLGIFFVHWLPPS